jgi:hypothetical protein
VPALGHHKDRLCDVTVTTKTDSRFGRNTGWAINAQHLPISAEQAKESRMPASLRPGFLLGRFTPNQCKVARVSLKFLDADTAKDDHRLLTVIVHNRAPTVLSVAHVLPGLQFHELPPD